MKRIIADLKQKLKEENDNLHRYNLWVKQTQENIVELEQSIATLEKGGSSNCARCETVKVIFS